MTDFPVVVFHNPACSTSRNVVQSLREGGHQPTVVEYLKAGWTRPQLETLFAQAGLTAREALREKGPPAAELGLLEGASEDAIFTAMTQHPILVNRPIVVTPLGARLCRPAERLAEVLPA
jgi:arsenate reductase